jgi:periplasmic divalent cation tolerance protein
LEESLVACVQIDAGVESHYRWEGKMEVAEEYRLTAKTTAILGERVIERLEELHPYDTPEIILVAVDSVAQRYAQWVASEVKSSP